MTVSGVSPKENRANKVKFECHQEACKNPEEISCYYTLYLKMPSIVEAY